PDEPGPDVGRLRRIALPAMPAALWRALVDELARERLVVLSGAWLHLPEHAVTLSASDQTLARKLQPPTAAAGFDPPWVRELAARVHEPEERVREVLRKQVTQGGVYQVVRDLFYDRERIAELAEIVGAATREHGGVNAARFRDTLGTGRKRAIQILEFFDRVGYTRRVRDAPVPRRWLRLQDRAGHARRSAQGLSCRGAVRAAAGRSGERRRCRRVSAQRAPGPGGDHRFFHADRR